MSAPLMQMGWTTPLPIIPVYTADRRHLTAARAATGIRRSARVLVRRATRALSSFQESKRLISLMDPSPLSLIFPPPLKQHRPLLLPSFFRTRTALPSRSAAKRFAEYTKNNNQKIPGRDQCRHSISDTHCVVVCYAS